MIVGITSIQIKVINTILEAVFVWLGKQNILITVNIDVLFWDSLLFLSKNIWLTHRYIKKKLIPIQFERRYSPNYPGGLVYKITGHYKKFRPIQPLWKSKYNLDSN